jgi:hypothetical protein
MEIGGNYLQTQRINRKVAERIRFGVDGRLVTANQSGAFLNLAHRAKERIAMLKRRLIGMAAVVVVVGLALASSATPRAEAQGWKAERLLSAVYELRKAESEINSVKHDFGGHRKYAVLAINAAVEQCEKLLKEAGVPLKFVERAEYPKAYGLYPHLRHAIVECEAARTEIEGTKEKWGHKEQALRDLTTAIEQLRIAEKYAK